VASRAICRMTDANEEMHMVRNLKERLEQRFDEEIRFFKGWQKDKLGVGCLVPTSAVTARRMASIIETASGLPVLEVGAGTGVITKAILERGVKPSNLVSIEYAPHFVEVLRERFPDVDVREGDVFKLDEVLGERRRHVFDCVVSAIPMLSFKPHQRVGLMKDLLGRIPRGRPVMQITHGPKAPVPASPEDYTIQHFDFVVRNLPPAQLWLYRSV
jgi:phosphatidylethanolamine/phosphatidyl-N-methylethanolamine N-methyltransferase